MSSRALRSNQTMEVTGARREVFAANDVRTLIANNLRSLTCRCPASHQPVDPQIYADHATLTRIRSKSVRFQCPHCGAEHETRVGAACAENNWLEPHQSNCTRHRHATAGPVVCQLLSELVRVIFHGAAGNTEAFKGQCAR
jgi:predicted RNA-binding Zn-ribbon protein involved in translation (DUF1610 family)